MTNTASTSLPAIPATPGRMGRTAALWLNASILVAYLAASTAPSPLYALYREAWGFSALTLTVVFSTYAFALLGALLFFGALSDHRGRREIVLVSLGLEIASLLVFRHDQHGVGHLRLGCDAARVARHRLRDGRGVGVQAPGEHAGHQVALGEDALHRAGAVDDEDAAAIGARHRAC